MKIKSTKDTLLTLSGFNQHAPNPLYYGASWYPELWDAATLKQDIAVMKKVGINLVRIGDFAWSFFEPDEDHIDVSPFIQIINTLDEHGIKTIVCTPTASAPVWMSFGHPERLYVDKNGQKKGHGSRQHICTNNPYFRKKSLQLIARLAAAVGKLPGVAAWQLDNEFKAHVGECCCDTCLELWHLWLQKRYGTIDELNRLWCTGIWSERYQSFEQVPQPGPTPFIHNSSLQTMYRLFSRDMLASFADEQAAVIRKYSPAPITHNGSVGFHVDNVSLFRNLDFTSFDTYAAARSYPAYLFNCDLWRNYKPNHYYWLLETCPSFAACLDYHGTPHPSGYLTAETIAAYASGAQAFCYWLWRQQRGGCEQLHSSVLSAWGEPAAGYKEVCDAARARAETAPVISSSETAYAEVALSYSDTAKVFWETEPVDPDTDYRTLITDFYTDVSQNGVFTDVVPPGTDLSRYKLLFTPFVPHIPEQFTAAAVKMVRNGGVWIVGPVSGWRTEEHTVPVDSALGGGLEKLAGIKINCIYPLKGTDTYGNAFGLRAPLSGVCFAFDAEPGTGVKKIGFIENHISSGACFLSEVSCGSGKIVMLGARPSGIEGRNMMRTLVDYYCREAGVTLRLAGSEGIRATPRKFQNRIIWVITNMKETEGYVQLEKGGTDLLQNSPVGAGVLKISGFGYRILDLSEKPND